MNVFREVLISCINKANYKNQSRINKILVGDIEKLRFIPHKVIFLIDMNSVYYPRISNNENINLMNKKYLLGDPSVFDREKYFFLELLISCRKKLIVSWTSYDKDKKKLDISFPIKELISYFESFLTKNQKEFIIKELDHNNDFITNYNNGKNLNIEYSLIKKIDWTEKKFERGNYSDRRNC